MVHWKAPLPLLAFPSGPPQLWIPIRDDTVSNVASYDLTWSEDIALLWLRLFGVIPATNGVAPYLRTSGDGGSTFDSGASDYQFHALARVSALGFVNSTGAAQLQLNPIGVGTDVGNTAGYGITGDVLVFNPGAGKQTNILSHLVYRNSSTNPSSAQTQGARKSAALVDGLQVFFSLGNISSGRFVSRAILAYGEGP